MGVSTLRQVDLPTGEMVRLTSDPCILTSVVVADLVNRADGWMIERRCGPRLTTEAGNGCLVGRDMLRQKLQRHFAKQLKVLGKIDNAHSAAAELRLDPVVTDDGAGRQRQHRGTL